MYIDPAEVTDIEEWAEHQSIAQRIVAALRSGAMSVQELADDLETAAGTVRKTLNRHNDELFTVVAREGRATWWGNLVKEA